MKIGQLFYRFRIQKIKSALDIGLFLVVLKTFISFSSVIPHTNSVDSILTIVASVFLVFYTITRQFRKKTLFLYAIIVLVMGFISYNVGNFSLLLTTLVVLSIRKESIDNVIKFLFQYELLLFVLQIIIVIALRFTGISYYVVIGGITRYTLGFIHPNTLALYYLNLLSMWTWLHYDDIRWRHITGIVLLSTCVYFICKTRTLVAEAIILVILILLKNEKLKNTQKVVVFFSKIAFPIITILFYVAIKNFSYTNIYINGLDTLLSGRLRLSAYALEYNGLTILGQDLSSFTATWDNYWNLNSFTFDSLYGVLLINYGLVLTFVIALILYKLANYKSIKVSTFILLFVFYGITEVHGINCIAFFPLILAMLIFDNNMEIYRSERHRS